MTADPPRYSELVYEAHGDLLEWLAERDGTPAEAQREVYGTPTQRRYKRLPLMGGDAVMRDA